MNDPLFQYFYDKRQLPSSDLYYDTGGLKTYRRAPIIPLPPAEKPQALLADSLKNRKSSREFSTRPLLLEEISTLLFWATGLFKDGDNKNGALGGHRPYPSGGGKYPLEFYPVILRCDNITNGVYHYNVEKHSLENLFWVEKDDLRKGFSVQHARDAGMVVLVSFIKAKQIVKYGNFSYKLGLVEAGHAGQNMYLLSSALGLGCCAWAVKDPLPLNSALALDGINETVCYALAVGSIA